MPGPDRLGRYRVIRPLGSGAFATVWLAHDDGLDAEVAVKVLADNWSHRLDVHERFLQEAQILRRCDSDRVVQVHDLGELDDGRPYFVMAYADRGTLADRLDAGPLDVPTAVGYAVETALGVAALHDIGVIHRDVKPSNVLLRTGRGGGERVLVADLGVAKAAARASGFTLAAGTPGYMAPEQATGRGIDLRSDVHALGALLHELLTGALPGDAPARPVPAGLDRVVARALAVDPRDRYPDAAVMAAALSDAGVSPRPTPTAASLPRTLAAAPESRAATAVLQWPTSAPPPPAPPPPPAATGPLAAASAAAEPARAPVLPRRGRRTARRAAAAAGTALLLAGAAGGLALGRRAASEVTVRDATGRLSVTVPAAWAAQLQDSEWDLARYGRAGTHGWALAVSPDVQRWHDVTSGTPGVFVGLAPGVTAERLEAGVTHPDCTGPASRVVDAGRLRGRARRFTGCGGTSVAYDEVALDGPDHVVYVQVKAPNEKGLDRTGAILAALHVQG